MSTAERMRNFLFLVLMLTLLPEMALAGALPLTIVFSGDTDGEYEACGCPGSPMGGFARRASVLRNIAQEGTPHVVLDAGNALSRGALVLEPAAKQDRRLGHLMAQLLADVGTQAVAVGPRDLWAVGLKELISLADKTQIPWLSANITEADGSYPFPPHIVLKAGLLRVGVVGLTEPQLAIAERDHFTFRDPIDAAREQADLLKNKVDLLVALSNLTYERHRELRRQVPAFDLIVAGTPGEGVPKVSNQGPPWEVRVEGLGRVLGRLEVRLSPGAQAPLLHSQSLEQRLHKLEGVKDALESLKATILEEEGHPNPERFEREGAFLRQRLQELSQDPTLEADNIRVFGRREIILFEQIEEDSKVKKRIQVYENQAHKPAAGQTSPPTK